MKTMTAFAATLAAGIALAPMAANAAIITFSATGSISYGGRGGALSGSIMAAPMTIIGQNTLFNPGEYRTCYGCRLDFSTGENLIDPPPLGPGISGEFEWKGGGFLDISEWSTTSETYTTLLTGTFVEPVTATLVTFTIPSSAYGNFSLKGLLENVVIDEDLAAYYGVPNQGTGAIEITASDRFTSDGSSIHYTNAWRTVTFSPVPVPAALPLMLTALAGLGVIRLRRMHAAA